VSFDSFVITLEKETENGIGEAWNDHLEKIGVKKVPHEHQRFNQVE
jgi:hypothetical protein